MGNKPPHFPNEGGIVRLKKARREMSRWGGVGWVGGGSDYIPKCAGPLHLRHSICRTAH